MQDVYTDVGDINDWVPPKYDILTDGEPGEEPKPEPEPETKVDKHCVRVLKVEGAYYRVLKTLLITIPFTVLDFIFKGIITIALKIWHLLQYILNFITSRINWCIVKSIGRIIYVPVFPVFAGGFFWNLFTANIHNWLLDKLPQVQAIPGCNSFWDVCLQRGMQITMVPNYSGAYLIEIGGGCVVIILCLVYCVSLFAIMNSTDPELQIVQKSYQKKME